MQPSQRHGQESRIVHRGLFHQRTPVCPRFQIRGSPGPQRVSEKQPGYRETRTGTFPPSGLSFLSISSPRCQLLEIARSLKYMHNLGIVHGNVKTVRPILAMIPYRALTFF
jgi:serine/threonine protein kinase